jgi:hypothetical protein
MKTPVRLTLVAAVFAFAFPAVSISAPPLESDHVKVCLQRCDDLYELDIGECWNDNFVSPSNSAYSICLLEAFVGFHACRADCD